MGLPCSLGLLAPRDHLVHQHRQVSWVLRVFWILCIFRVIGVFFILRVTWVLLVVCVLRVFGVLVFFGSAGSLWLGIFRVLGAFLDPLGLLGSSESLWS